MLLFLIQLSKEKVGSRKELMEVQGGLKKLNQQAGSKFSVGPRSSGFQTHDLIFPNEPCGLLGRGLGNQDDGQTKGKKQKKKHRKARKTETYRAKQMKRPERVRCYGI